jgi:uncharacterized membrane protein YfcA
MGTVAGVLVGATVLKLLPEKLRFVADYRLLTFGLLLVVMMRSGPRADRQSSGVSWSSTRTTRSSPSESRRSITSRVVSRPDTAEGPA